MSCSPCPAARPWQYEIDTMQSAHAFCMSSTPGCSQSKSSNWRRVAHQHYTGPEHAAMLLRLYMSPAEDILACSHHSNIWSTLLGCSLQGYLFRAAFLRRIPLFARNLVENVLLCLVASGIESSAVRWLTSIELGWRDVLTARIHKSYFLNMVSFTIEHGMLRLEASMIFGHIADQIAHGVHDALVRRSVHCSTHEVTLSTTWHAHGTCLNISARCLSCLLKP